jgi:hypothetical protein
MPRYLIERLWDEMEEEERRMKGAVSKGILADDERFTGVKWEHSHVVIDDEGRLKSYCVYTSPNTELVRSHAHLLGDHEIVGIYEIGGDVSPDDFPDA